MKKWVAIVCLSASTAAMAWGEKPSPECKTIVNQNMAQLQKQGIEQADKKSQYEVAQLYEYGCGVKRDLYQAYAWYRVAGRYLDAGDRLTTLYDSFKGSWDKATDAYYALEKKVKPYRDKIYDQNQKESEAGYLNLIDGARAHTHPAAVIKEFNDSVKATESTQ